MSTTRPNPIVRLLPGLTDVVFLMPIVFLFARLEGAKTMLSDGDTGWHIRTGQWILANGRVPHEDFFSFTKPGQPWFAWEWLWDVCFAWLYQHGGLASVVTGSILVLCLTFALLFRLVKRNANPFLAVGITFLAVAASSLHWLARPHLFTLLFVVLLMMLLDQVQRGRTRLLLVLPILTVLWTNTHGGFLAEFLILAAYIGGIAVKALLTSDTLERSGAIHKLKWFSAVTLACAAATLVNPYGYHLHQHLLRYFSEPYHFQNIAEYQSVSFHQGGALYLELLLASAAITAVWFVVKKRDFVPVFLLLGWAHLALFAARNIPLFAIVAAPFIAQCWTEMLIEVEGSEIAGRARRALATFRETAVEFQELDRVPRLHLLSIAAGVLIAVLLSSPAATGNLKPEYDPTRYPTAALRFVQSMPDARVFTDDEWGDYLIYQLYPKQKVFVDGRSDFYGQDFEQKYFDLIAAKYDWEQSLRSYGINTIVLSPRTPLATAIKESGNWRVVYDDTIAVVFAAHPRETPPFHEISIAASDGKNRHAALSPKIRSGRGNTDHKTKGAITI